MAYLKDWKWVIVPAVVTFSLFMLLLWLTTSNVLPPTEF